MIKFTPILFAIALVCVLHGTAQATALSDLAAAMQPGQWKELSTLGIGDTGHLLYMNCNKEYWWADVATTWSNYLCWNPATRDILWTGAPHMGPFQFLRYNETTNTWTNETNVPDCMRLTEYKGCFNHGYDLGTIDQDKGIYYYKSTSTFFSYIIGTKTWAQWSIAEFSPDRADGMAWFPPLKKLCHVIGGNVRLVDPVTHAVESVSSGLSMGGYDNTAEFSPIHRKVYFGGGQGSKAFYSFDSAKKVTRLADAPEAFDCDRSSLACDPVTGSPLILANSNDYYVYNATVNQWSKITSPPAALNAPVSVAKAVMATGVPEYGVVFYMSPTLEKVYLYKHANTASNAVVPARTAPRINKQTRVEVYDLGGRRMGVFYGGVISTAGRPAGVFLIKAGSGAHHPIKKISFLR